MDCYRILWILAPRPEDLSAGGAARSIYKQRMVSLGGFR